MNRRTSIEWSHPTGNVVEIVCDRHESDVLQALRTLGIGCSASKADGDCVRCFNPGVPFRLLLSVCVEPKASKDA